MTESFGKIWIGNFSYKIGGLIILEKGEVYVFVKVWLQCRMKFTRMLQSCSDSEMTYKRGINF